MATLKNSTYLAVTTSSQSMKQLAQGQQYRFCATVDCLITITVTGGSADYANGSHLVKAGQAVGVTAVPNNQANSFLHVEGLAAGHATLSEVG